MNTDTAQRAILAVRVEEAARLLSCSRGHVYNLMQRGELASFHIGRSRRILLSDLEALASPPDAA